MKKFFLFLACIFLFWNTSIKANDELIQLLNIAVEIGDIKIYRDVLEAILKQDNHNENLLSALSKYSEKGKIDFALHNAIKDGNLLASVILTNYAKIVNTRRLEYEVVWLAQNSGCSRPNKSPIELTIDSDMKGLMPYLLMKNANPYEMRQIWFLYDDEENVDYLQEFGYTPEKKTCVKSKKVFYPILFPVNMSRTFIC